MKSVNKVTLLGAVGQDPETRFSQAGLPICTFSLATSEKRKDKPEVTQWHSCVAFGKLAEIVQQYIAKGSKIYAEGTIQYQTYDKEGEKRYATKIVLNDVSMLSSNNSLGSNKPSPASVSPSADRDLSDDIPF